MLRGILQVIGGMALVAGIIMFGWYQIDGQPTESSAKFLVGEGYTVTIQEDGGYLFRPERGNGMGIVIMHGALIKPQAYAKTAAYFTQHGYTVLLPNGPARMSIAATEATAARLDSFGLRGWFFIGHSMGAMASMQLVRDHGAVPRAIALWSGSMPANFTNVDVPILFIWGDTDGLLPPERLAVGQANLPEHVEYVTLEGANHKNFALYSHQFFDNEATLNWDAQIDFANETTYNFFKQYRDQ